jgi:DNA-binding response OmpR family regulator
MKVGFVSTLAMLIFAPANSASAVVKIRLAGRPFQVLALLLEHPGELLTRREWQERLRSADTFGCRL